MKRTFLLCLLFLFSLNACSDDSREAQVRRSSQNVEYAWNSFFTTNSVIKAEVTSQYNYYVEKYVLRRIGSEIKKTNSLMYPYELVLNIYIETVSCRKFNKKSIYSKEKMWFPYCVDSDFEHLVGPHPYVFVYQFDSAQNTWELKQPNNILEKLVMTALGKIQRISQVQRIPIK